LNHSRTPVRRRSERRRKKLQRTFPGLRPEGEQDSEDFPVLDFKSFPYRTALANWPDEWRERWGHRANALEERGMSWHDAEAQAFFEIQEERRAEVGTQPIPLARPLAEHN
jgi:hypothetical protein